MFRLPVAHLVGKENYIPVYGYMPTSATTFVADSLLEH